MTNFKLAKRPNNPFSKFDLSSRNIASRTSYVTVVYYHWKTQNFGTSSNVQSSTQVSQIEADAESYLTGVIETDIAACSITKGVEQPSANFSISLFPTQNWKGLVAPGDWLVIYFHSSIDSKEKIPSNTKNMVLVGNIDRVARTLQKDEETDTTQLRYEITGRNFGKVFEETDIWFDPYVNQDGALDVALREAGLELTGSPDDQVEQTLDIFLGPGTKGTTRLGQWKIPKALSRLIAPANAYGGNYFDSILLREVELNLPGYKPRNQITLNSNGSLWDMLKRSCNSIVNALYLEETRWEDGSVRPTITLKPRPHNTPALDTRGYYSQFGQRDDTLLRGLIKYTTMQQLAVESYIEISPAEIIYENIGKDDHSRINLLWFNTLLGYEYLLSPTSNVNGSGSVSNPVFSRPHIQRHGLRRMEALLEFCHAEEGGIAFDGPQTNSELFKAFAGQLYDMHFANHLYEQGTIECTGVLEAELGKALIVKSAAKGVPDKVFYIEGYDHKWTFPSTWRTTFTVSKGQWKTTSDRIFIDVSDADKGQPDTTIGNSYSSKTAVRGG